VETLHIINVIYLYMENQNSTPPINNGEKTRKRKLLTDPERMGARCRVCQEPGNVENMLWQKIPLKDSQGQVI
jgi:hypothetical protein